MPRACRTVIVVAVAGALRSVLLAQMINLKLMAGAGYSLGSALTFVLVLNFAQLFGENDADARASIAAVDRQRDDLIKMLKALC